MKVLSIIPARGGSKGIKNKNIKLLNGKPLISYVYNAAKKVKLINDIILTTDSKKISLVAKKLGINVPFMRPKKFAKDNSTQVKTIEHAVRTYEKMTNKVFDIIVLLQPTCPLTQPHHIKSAIELIIKKKYDSVGSITLLKDTHPAFQIQKIRGGYKRIYPRLKGIDSRHKLKKIYRACGNVYAVNKINFLKQKKFTLENNGYIYIDSEYTSNINDKFDWIVAQSLIKNLKRFK